MREDNEMSTLNGFGHHKTVSLCTLLLTGLLLFSIHTAQATTCDRYDRQVDRALYAEDIVQLGRLLTKLKRLPDCSYSYLDWLKRRMSKIAADKAKYWVQRGRLSKAERWLRYKYAPVTSWVTQSVRGDIAAKRKQWHEAAVFYGQALDLIADPGATPQRPPRAEIKRVYRLAVETQLLAGTLTTVRSTGQPSGTMRDDLGLVIKEHPIPVQFVFNRTTLTEKGQDSVEKLLNFLQEKKPNRIILMGHTDHWGSDGYNCSLSKARASAVKNYLVAGGIAAERITTLGKGERKPLELYDPTMYTQQQIDQINRRVEFAIDSDVSYDNFCP
jgi:outer membrane protein OmpA-like peptidoglycan-associated protein